MSILGIIPFLLYLGILGFGIYAVVAIIKSAKQRNEYLKEIRDEMRKKI
ncbi:hypothetical protein MKZ26_08695 [Sporosarcina sp. FSL K6-6792]